MYFGHYINLFCDFMSVFRQQFYNPTHFEVLIQLISQSKMLDISLCNKIPIYNYQKCVNVTFFFLFLC